MAEPWDTRDGGRRWRGLSVSAQPCGSARTPKLILEASEALDGFQQESDTVVCVFTRSPSLLCVWRGKKEQGDLAGATAGV